MEIARIEVEAFCYPTEDKEKVIKGLNAVAAEQDFKEEKVESYYGPQIIKLSLCTEKQQEIKRLLEQISRIKIRDAAERVDDEGVLHLRFDKQSASKGKLELGTGGDTIKAKIKICSFPFSLEVAKKKVKEMFS